MFLLKHSKTKKFLDSFNGNLSVYFPFIKTSTIKILFKKRNARLLWMLIIFLPCLIKGAPFSGPQVLSKNNYSPFVFLCSGFQDIVSVPIINPTPQQIKLINELIYKDFCGLFALFFPASAFAEEMGNEGPQKKKECCCEQAIRELIGCIHAILVGGCIGLGILLAYVKFIGSELYEKLYEKFIGSKRRRKRFH